MIKGKNCSLLNFEQLTDPNTRLTCEVPTPATTASDYYGNRGINLITDPVFTAFAGLQTATPSANSASSTTDRVFYQTNITSPITIWLKGYLKLAKASQYDFEVKTNGDAVVLLSNDSTSAQKTLIASSNAPRASRTLNGDT